MFAYIVRRLLILPIVVFVSISIMFSLFSMLPPAVKVFAYVGENPKALQGNAIDQLIKIHHLDASFLAQFSDWLTQVIHGNLGWSTSQNMPVVQALTGFIPATLELVLYSILPILVGGIVLGVLSAVKQNHLVDQITRTMSILAYSVPVFVVGLVLLLVFYGGLGLFGTGRLGNASILIVQNSALWQNHTGLYTIDALLNGRLDVFWDALMHLVLPVITLSFINWALLVRISRSSMLNTLHEDYVTTARAKGLQEGIIIRRHALRNASIPIITISTLLIGQLLSGVVITETVFQLHGIGYFLEQAALHLDIAGVLGFVIFSALLWVITNLAADLLYAYADPRVRMD